MNRKGFSYLDRIARVITLLGIAGCVLPIKTAAPPVQATVQQQTKETDTQTIEPDTTTPQEVSADWKTYRNKEFGFEFMYPPELKFVSSGPNEVQKALDRGEMISGTAAPSYDTITFLNSENKEQFDATIFWIRDDEVSPDGFKEGYLWYGSDCDLRWNYPIIEGPTLVGENGISILEVQVLAAMPFEEYKYRGCYYFKNSAGNVIVFGISSFEQKSDFLNVFHLTGDKILPTLRLIK